jgi:hypothetical protein
MRELSVAEQRYRAALAVISDGLSISQVAGKVGVSRQTNVPVPASSGTWYTDGFHRLVLDLQSQGVKRHAGARFPKTKVSCSPGPCAFAGIRFCAPSLVRWLGILDF